MRKPLLTFIAGCFYYSGLVKLARWWTRRRNKCLVILNYHRATGGDLHHHLLYLRQHYRILHLAAALEELYTPLKEGEWLHDRRTPLVLTFDDGYQDNYTHGFPLAQALQVPMTIFLVPGYLESRDYFWWREGVRLAQRANVSNVTIEGRTYHLDQPKERKALAQIIDARVRHASSVVEREMFLTTVREILAVSTSVVAEEQPSLPFGWSEVREMQASQWISFGAHTMHHPILAYLSDRAEIQHEVEECRTILRQQLGHEVRTFAYPVGQLQHIGADVVDSVQKAGYDWAVTTMYGFNTPRSDPYLLKRIEVDVSQHWLVVAAEAAGLWGFFTRLRWIPLVRRYFTGA